MFNCSTKKASFSSFRLTFVLGGYFKVVQSVVERFITSREGLCSNPVEASMFFSQAPKSAKCLNWNIMNCEFVIALSFFSQHFPYHNISIVSLRQSWKVLAGAYGGRGFMSWNPHEFQCVINLTVPLNYLANHFYRFVKINKYRICPK